MAFVIGQDPIFALSHFLSSHDDDDNNNMHPAAKTYFQDANAIASTPVDVKELPNGYVFIADLPGLKSSDIKLQVDSNNVLTIGGERKRPDVNDHSKYLRLERPSGPFLRKFTLPGNAKVDAITANSVDGVLEVTVPKIPPPQPQQPKIIPVADATNA